MSEFLEAGGPVEWPAAGFLKHMNAYVVQRKWPLLALGAGDLVAFAINMNIGLIVTAIGGISLAVVGAVASAIKTVGPAWLEYVTAREQKRQDLAARQAALNKESLAAQIEVIKREGQAQIAIMSRELVFVKSCLERSTAESARLTAQLQVQLHDVRVRVEDQHNDLQETKAVVVSNTEAIVRAAQSPPGEFGV